MGHNTDFLTRVANNVIYTLTDAQMAALVKLASAQLENVNFYAYERFSLMEAFRRTLTGNIPSGSTGLNLDSVKKASHDLYLIDGQLAFDRAMLYVSVYNSMTPDQIDYLEAMKGKGFNEWPNITDAQIASKMSNLPQGTATLVMTYASDIFTWYEGSLYADVYFCPERHGTYYGGFYIKDAPAVGESPIQSANNDNNHGQRANRQFAGVCNVRPGKRPVGPCQCAEKQSLRGRYQTSSGSGRRSPHCCAASWSPLLQARR